MYKDKEYLLKQINRIKEILKKNNDGSFIIEDLITKEIEELQEDSE